MDGGGGLRALDCAGFKTLTADRNSAVERVNCCLFVPVNHVNHKQSMVGTTPVISLGSHLTQA